MVRAGGLEPPRAKPDGFSYQLRLSPPCRSCQWRPRMFVVWTIPSPCPQGWPPQDLGAARLVSTPSRHRARIASGRCRAWLGIAMPKGSPNLSSSTSHVSARALVTWRLSSPLRLPISPRPHMGIARIERRVGETKSQMRGMMRFSAINCTAPPEGLRDPEAGPAYALSCRR